MALIVTGAYPGIKAAAETVLNWLTGESHRQGIRTIKGLTRQHASQEGNALGVCSRLGILDDERVWHLAQSLAEWQWPDGGWNCDTNEHTRHSSFNESNESLTPLWGLIEYQRATDDDISGETAEFFLRHRLFRSERTGDVIDHKWLDLHYPLYWHYDVLQGLRVIGMLGKLDDPRAQETLDIIEDKRLPYGRWRPNGCYWTRPGSKSGPPEVVD